MSENLLSSIRAEAPLIHNITNYVVMNTTANALLALGASPVMAITGIAGEMAAAEANGPGSFQMHFLDSLYRLDDAELARRQKTSFA